MTELVQGEEQIGTVETDAGSVDTNAPTQPTPDTPSDPFEAVAREHGWTPREEWRGKPDDWREPREFIGYGMKRSREKDGELKDLRREVGQIGRTAEAIQRRAVEEARREVETRFAYAVENKDHEGARAAREDLARLDTPEQAPDPAPVADFMKRNTWFGQDAAATALAQTTTARLAAQGVSPADQLAQAEAAVHARFPEYSASPRQQAKQPAAVNAPDTRAANTRPQAKNFASLPADAQRAGHDFHKRGMVKNLEDYAKVYFEENA